MKYLISAAFLVFTQLSLAQSPADYYRVDYEGQDRDQKKLSDPGLMRGPDDKSFHNCTEDGKKESFNKKFSRQIGNGANCPSFSNPSMEKQEWLGLIQKTEKLLNSRFGDAFKSGPNWKAKLDQELEVLKQDPTCVSKSNDCRLRLQAVSEYYTDVLSPNLPDPFKGSDPAKSKMKDADLVLAKYQEYKKSLGLYSKAFDFYQEAHANAPAGKTASSDFNLYLQLTLKQEVNSNSTIEYLIRKKKQALKTYKEPTTEPIYWQQSFTTEDLDLISKDKVARDKIIADEVKIGWEDKSIHPKSTTKQTALDFTTEQEMRGFKNSLKTAQSILIDEKNKFDEDLGALIEPRTGADKAGGSNTCSITKHYPRQWDKFSAENFLLKADEIPPPPKLPCVEQITVIDEQDLKVTFKPGDYLLDATQGKVISDQLLEIVSAKKAEGFTVTGYKVVASASYPYGKLSTTDAFAKNTELAQNRANSAKSILAGVSTLSESESKDPDVGVYGPQVSLSKYGANSKLKSQTINPDNEAEVKELYDYLKPYFDERKMFPTQADYQKYLKDQAITDPFDATFKAFQAFKVVVYGKKSSEKPCGAEVVIKTGTSSGTSKGSGQ